MQDTQEHHKCKKYQRTAKQSKKDLENECQENKLCKLPIQKVKRKDAQRQKLEDKLNNSDEAQDIRRLNKAQSSTEKNNKRMKKYKEKKGALKRKLTDQFEKETQALKDQLQVKEKEIAHGRVGEGRSNLRMLL